MSRENETGQACHKSVMLAETLADLARASAERCLDGSVGLGGHAKALLDACPGLSLCGLDRDARALALARDRLQEFGSRANLFHAAFADFASPLRALGWDSVDLALLDLGVSSLQLDDPSRGFSFRASGPLDMRMDQNSGVKSAYDLVNKANFSELRDIFATLGEEPQAGRVARRVLEERQKAPIEDTARLAAIIRGAFPASWLASSRRHPATRCFQALRMSVNDELGQLKIFLDNILAWLAYGARLVIISFHSLEDRMVKRAMRSWADSGLARLLHKKPLVPTEAEIKDNPRAASAKLRAIEKIRSAEAA